MALAPSDERACHDAGMDKVAGEPTRDPVEVAVQMLLVDRSLMDAEQPSFEERRGA